MSSKPPVHTVPVNVIRTADTIRDDVLSSVCKTIFSTGAACDPGKKPSEYNWTEQFWLQVSRDICGDLKQTYPVLLITDSQNLPFHTKKIADYCEFLFTSVTTVVA